MIRVIGALQEEDSSRPASEGRPVHAAMEFGQPESIGMIDEDGVALEYRYRFQ